MKIMNLLLKLLVNSLHGICQQSNIRTKPVCSRILLRKCACIHAGNRVVANFATTLLIGLILFGGCNQKKPSEELSSENVLLTAAVQPESCAVGETIALTIHLESSGKNKISEPKTKGILQGFSVVSRSVSKQMNYINGKKSEALDIILVLLAEKTGKWTIPVYEVHLEDGRVFSTQEISVVVSGSAPGKNKRKRGSQDMRPTPEKKDLKDNDAITI
jgi:hypothetical protein